MRELQSHIAQRSVRKQLHQMPASSTTRRRRGASSTPSRRAGGPAHPPASHTRANGTTSTKRTAKSVENRAQPGVASKIPSATPPVAAERSTTALQSVLLPAAPPPVLTHTSTQTPVGLTPHTPATAAAESSSFSAPPSPRRKGLCRACLSIVAASLLWWSGLLFSLPYLFDALDPDDRLAAAILQVGFLQNVSERITQAHVPPGKWLRQEGYRAVHPIVIIPGITSTPLEVWEGKACMRNQLRQRVWGEGVMVQKLLLNPLCWFEHLMLNSTTGLDPDGIKLRASTGLRAMESLVVCGAPSARDSNIGTQPPELWTFLQDAYTVWGAFIHNAAELGYDESNMMIATYDWRLAMPMLEVRDRYYTRLKLNIEELYHLQGRKRVVILAHSMGNMVYYYFTQWLHSVNATSLSARPSTVNCDISECFRPAYCSAPPGTRITPREHAFWAARADTCGLCSCRYRSWVDKYVEAYMNIAGPMLGVPKVVPATLSGEMRDTAEMPAMFTVVKEAFASRRMMRSAFRSFQSMINMWPIGGNRIWGGQPLALDTAASAHALAVCDTTEAAQNSPPWSVCRRPLHEPAPDQEPGLADVTHMMVVHIDESWLLAHNTSVTAVAPPLASAKTQFSDAAKAALSRIMDVLQSSGVTAANITSPSVLSNLFGSGDDEGAFGAAERASAEGRLAQIMESEVGNTEAAEAVTAASWEHGMRVLRPNVSTASPTVDPTPLADRAVFLTYEDVLTVAAARMPKYFETLQRLANLTAWRPEHAYENPLTLALAAGHVAPVFWANALVAPLPDAPTTGIFCLYGTGKPTERAYHYTSLSAEDEEDPVSQPNPSSDSPPDAASGSEIPAKSSPLLERFKALQDAVVSGKADQIQSSARAVLEQIMQKYGPNATQVGRADSDEPGAAPPPATQIDGVPVPLPDVIATSVSAPELLLNRGIRANDGDATIPLLSLGYMCAKGWQDPLRNPGGSPVTTREYRHLERDLAPTEPNDQPVDVRNLPRSHSAPGIPSSASSRTIVGMVHRATADVHPTAAPARYPPGPNSAAETDVLADLLLTGMEILRALTSQGPIQAGLNMLRGASSADHVDVLLNTRFITDALKVAAGSATDVKDSVSSKIHAYAARVRDTL